MSANPDDKVEMIVEIVVPAGYRAAERLDVHVADKIADLSRSKVQRHVKEERVAVNGKVEKRPGRVIQANDVITIRLMRPPPMEAHPEDIPLNVLYEDDALLVVNKPAGMVVHPAYGNHSGTLVNALLYYVGAGAISLQDDDSEDDDEIGLSTESAGPQFEGDLSIRPGIVHRLDKGTSGLLVVAKTDAVHAKLAAQFSKRTIRRLYEAIVWGVPNPPSGMVESQLGRDPRDRKRMAVVKAPQGKHAITHYEVLEELTPYHTLMQFRLETGRTHQIRVHAKYLGHPILGDETYGGTAMVYGPDTANRKKFFANLFTRMPDQSLHAKSLGFVHPVSGEKLYFEAPMPEEMAYVMERLKEVEG